MTKEGPKRPSQVAERPQTPVLIKKSAPTGQLPIRDPASGVGGSVPTQHLPSKPDKAGGGGGDGGGSKSDG